MGLIKYIEPGKRGVLAGLFKNHKRQRMLIDSVIEGYVAGFGHGDLCAAFADSERDPQVAQITLESFTMFGGDPKHPVARELIKKLPRTVPGALEWDGKTRLGAVIHPESKAWRDLMVQIYGDKLEKKQVVDFSSERLSLDHLRELRRCVPEGFQIKRLDMDLIRHLGYNPDKGGLGFVPLRKFAEHSIGFFVMEGDHRVVGTVCSYVMCKAGTEVDIGIDPDYRRRGLAKALGATFIAYCLENGIDPHWTTTDNPISNKLAEKLGYVQDDVYEALHLPFGPRTQPVLTFSNLSDRSVAVYWVTYVQEGTEKYYRVSPDYEGREKFYFTLAPGESRKIQTGVTHRWRIKDADSGEALQEDVIAIDETEVITIGGQT
jgi:GNAT superfamily N-acetyltransferase